MFELSLAEVLAGHTIRGSDTPGSSKLNRAQYNLKTKFFFVILLATVNGGSAASCSGLGQILGLCSNMQFCRDGKCFDESEFIIIPESTSTFGKFLEMCGLVGGFLYFLVTAFKIMKKMIEIIDQAHDEPLNGVPPPARTPRPHADRVPGAARPHEERDDSESDDSGHEDRRQNNCMVM
ncbi:uncharacterized protein LOC131938405 [Physella acuta]|uniref:uncharacterized protein LOC131938405 n=1 Tax=Physella acuta TaxID=109671 RepID=UPI0027DD5DE1|nr:uncharacterized protein LOC131938405 [Physella acuta]